MPDAERPNIVFILADDMGYGDVQVLNRKSSIPTPNLDRIASEGMTFHDAHSPSAVCTPTRYGLLTDWLGRRRAIPQQLVEDVLGSVLRGSGQQVPLATVLDYVEGRDVVIRRAIRALERQKLLTVEGEMLGLTSSGIQEARRLLRAHRLWETYLVLHADIATSHVDRDADLIEHVLDPDLVAQLLELRLERVDLGHKRARRLDLSVVRCSEHLAREFS